MISTAQKVDFFCIPETPFDVFALCRRFGIELMPLSYFLEKGIPREAFFALIGNTDGAAVTDGRSVKILYNGEKPRHRVRFTLMEELSHTLLGHLNDERFDIRNELDDIAYSQYEAEAKACAGLLLMSPPAYFRLRKNYTLSQIAAIFDISIGAAYLAARFCNEHEEELRAAYGKFAPHCLNLLKFKSPRAAKRPVNVWSD